MKFREFVVHVICFSLFLYFLIPVAIEYFNYATITTTYLPHFHSNFPRPKLFLLSNDEQDRNWNGDVVNPLGQNTSVLRELIFIDGNLANVSWISKVGNKSIYSIKKSELSAKADHRVGWNKTIHILKYRHNLIFDSFVHRFQLVIGYDGSDDNVSITFQPGPQQYSTVSAQIFRISPPPYGTCLDLNSLENPNAKCINVRYVRFKSLINSTDPNVLIANVISMLHEPEYKFPFSFFFILIFGLIGLFSDITAITINDTIEEIHTMFFGACKSIIKTNCMFTQFPTSKFSQVLKYFGLCILCMYHIATITEQYSQYDIQSSMYEGPSLHQSNPFTAEFCVRPIQRSGRPKTNVSLSAYNLVDTLIEFKIQGCYTDLKYLEVGDDACVELIAMNNCDMNSNLSINFNASEYVLYFEWDHLEFTFRERLSSSFYKEDVMQITLYPIQGSSFTQLSAFQFEKGVYDQFRTLYFRGEFLKYPYVTNCIDNYQTKSSINNQFNSNSFSELFCLEEAYIEYNIARMTKLPRKTTRVVITPSKRSFDMKIAPKMTVFDYISWVSTAIGFWLSLCILGSAEICLDMLVKHIKLKTILSILIWAILSSALSYFLVLRFEEYFQYDISSDMTYKPTPDGLYLPQMSFSILDRPSYKLYGNHIPSSMENCNYLLNRVNPLENISIVDSFGTISSIDPAIVDHPLCYTHRRKLILLIDIGKLLGPWNSQKHKYITIRLWEYIDMKYNRRGEYDIYGMTHESESIVERHSTNYDRESFYKERRSISGYNLGLDMEDKEFFANFKFQFDYLYSELLKPPYHTHCQDYRDPETYRDSWYYYLLNSTMRGGKLSYSNPISGKNNVTRYGHVDDNFMHEYNTAMECIRRANLKTPCISITSKMVIQAKDPTKLPGKIVIEPKTTVFTIFTPKTRPIDFFMLLLDQIGFWMGINFVFVCVYSIKITEKTYNLISKYWRKHDIEANIQDDSESVIDVGLYGGRLIAMKKWKLKTEGKGREKENQKLKS